MRLVPDAVTRAYRGRMLNVHPALLPEFGGAGMYGARVHRAVLQAGARALGADGTLRGRGVRPRRGDRAVARARAPRTTTSMRSPRACCAPSTCSIRASSMPSLAARCGSTRKGACESERFTSPRLPTMDPIARRRHLASGSTPRSVRRCAADHPTPLTLRSTRCLALFSPSPTRPALLDFARGLHALGWELISTGGTARALREAGVARARRRGRHAVPRDARRTREDAASRGARRPARAARSARAHGGDRRARHRADRSRRRESLSLPRRPRRAKASRRRTSSSRSTSAGRACCARRRRTSRR